MTTRLRTPRATVAAVALTLAAGLLAGCGSGATPSEVVVTVTSGSSPAASPSTGDSSSQPAPAGTVKSDVVGRKFDFGVVTGVVTEGDTQVLVFDRWTDPKVADNVLAQKGLTVTTYDTAKIPYENVNTKVTFRIPVRDGTSFLLHHCVQKGEPVTSKSVSATELANAPMEDKLVLLTIDKDGYTTGGETFAGC